MVLINSIFESDMNKPKDCDELLVSGDFLISERKKRISRLKLECYDFIDSGVIKKTLYEELQKIIKLNSSISNLEAVSIILLNLQENENSLKALEKINEKRAWFMF